LTIADMPQPAATSPTPRGSSTWTAVQVQRLLQGEVL
jgi:hypothetical protein